MVLMNQKVGVYLLNTENNVLLLHKRNRSNRHWTIPITNRLAPDKLEDCAYRALIENGIVADGELEYLGSNRVNNLRTMFHGFILRTDKFDWFETKEHDIYKINKASKARSQLPRWQRGCLELLDCGTSVPRSSRDSIPC